MAEIVIIKKQGKNLKDGDVINIAPPYQENPRYVWSSIVEVVPIFAPVGYRVWACKDFPFQFNVYHNDTVVVQTEVKL